jgi:hypothetical protein
MSGVWIVHGLVSFYISTFGVYGLGFERPVFGKVTQLYALVST